MGRPPAQGEPRNAVTHVRMTESEKRALNLQAQQRQQPDPSSYVRHLVAQDGERLRMGK